MLGSGLKKYFNLTEVMDANVFRYVNVQSYNLVVPSQLIKMLW